MNCTGATAPGCLRQLRAFLRIPSSTANPAGLQRAGEWLVRRLADRGWDLQVSGEPPLIIAARGDPSSAPLLIYSHYDVAAPNEDDWQHEPFGAVVDDGVIFACGARDTKAALLGAMHALEGHFERAPGSSLHALVVLEGEEKRESPDLMRRVRDYLSGSTPTAVLCADGGGYTQRDEPTIELGLKGQVGVLVELAHPTLGIPPTSLHAGHACLATNPNDVLVKLLAGLKDDRGRVTLGDFYATVQPPGQPYSEPLAKQDASFLRSLSDRYGYTLPRGRTAADVLNRLMFEPELNISSLTSGETGAERRVVPGRARAYLDISLVPGQVPADVVRSIEERVTQMGLPRDCLRVVASRPAYRCLPEDPFARSVVQAFAATHSQPVVALPSSASSGPVSALPLSLGCPMVRVGTGYRGHAHTPDEAVRIEHFVSYVKALGAVFADMVTPGRRSTREQGEDA